MFRCLLGCAVWLSFLLTPHTAEVKAQGLRVTPLEPAPTDRYDSVLQRYARPEGVDYEGLRNDAAAKRDLQTFVDSLDKMSERAELWQWLNAYNALVLSSVLQHYPIVSVKDVPGFFKEAVHRVAGKKRSLDEIENEIIRKRFNDARVHFALNCGAKSCPSLRRFAFRPASLSEALDALTRAALNDERHLRVSGGSIAVSALFFWFKADFVRAEGSVEHFIKKYAPEQVAQQLAKGVKLTELDYDWALNRAP